MTTLDHVPTTSPRTARLREAAGIAAVAIIGLLLAWLTWNISGDIRVDAGRDPYTAQQINAGRRLFTDLSYLYGPLPPYLMAWEFTLLGESLNVVRACNLAILAIVLSMIYSLVRRLSDPLLAALGCSIFMVLFGFGQLTEMRNYNFLLPYTTSATCAFTLCIATVFCLSQAARSIPNRWSFLAWSALAGAAAGLNFLVKPEFFLASTLTLAAGWTVILFALRPGTRAALSGGACAMIAFIVAPLMVLAMIGARVPWHDLWQGTIAGYRLASDPRVTSMPLFRNGLGLADAETTLPECFSWFLRYIAVLFPALVGSLCLRPGSSKLNLAAAATFLVYLVTSIALIPDDSLVRMAHGLPLVLLVAFLGATYAVKKRRDLSSAERWIFCFFCILMLLRMLLNARLYHYGFVSASPAFLLLLLGGGCWLPGALNDRNRAGVLVRFATIGLLIGVVWKHWQIEWRNIQAVSIPLPGGFAGAGERGQITQQALAELSARAKPGDTLAVWPEGAGINFATKLPNPTPFELLNPLGIIRGGGEAVIADAYLRHRPTWIMLVQLNTSEAGQHPFGIAYATRLREMLLADYAVEAVVGPHPYTTSTSKFGIAIYRLRTAPATAPTTLP